MQNQYLQEVTEIIRKQQGARPGVDVRRAAAGDDRAG